MDMKSGLIGAIAGLTIGLGSAAVAQVFATVDTNGVLQGYIVQKEGREICRNPMVFNQFRGPDSYIVCE